MVVPGETAVTFPVASIVATAGEDDTQAFSAAGVPDPIRLTLPPSQTESVPEITGLAFTVTESEEAQPLLLVQVITAVPAATPVTSPVALTVAMDVFEVDQGLPAAAVPPAAVSVMEDSAQTVFEPVMAGSGLTVTTDVAVQPVETL